MIYVKTVYHEKHMRLPNISKYPTKKEADSFIKTCLKWGIDIVSCKIVTDNEVKRLIANNAAEVNE